MTHFQMEQILALVKYRMTPELRASIARELPQAYNAWMGGQYARSVHNDGTDW